MPWTEPKVDRITPRFPAARWLPAGGPPECRRLPIRPASPPEDRHTRDSSSGVRSALSTAAVTAGSSQVLRVRRDTSVRSGKGDGGAASGPRPGLRDAPSVRFGTLFSSLGPPPGGGNTDDVSFPGQVAGNTCEERGHRIRPVLAFPRVPHQVSPPFPRPFPPFRTLMPPPAGASAHPVRWLALNPPVRPPGPWCRAPRPRGGPPAARPAAAIRPPPRGSRPAPPRYAPGSDGIRPARAAPWLR